jgi:NAD(P)-dependent dehydrogenase (short-subunit alcohol dehydrogenase family)
MTTELRVAVVTGAGSGIGRSVALALNREGWSVALAGRRLDALRQTSNLAASPDRMLAVATDVTDPDAVERLFDRAVERFGRVDLLFNNAGIFIAGAPLDETPVESIRASIDVNLLGAFLCARQAMRVMKTQTPKGGRIINNGSISAHTPRPNSAPYAATKHAITGLTKSIALDGRAFNIACGQIDIGNAATDLAAAFAKGVPQADGRIAPEPCMDVEHVARTVAHMAGLPLDANMPFVTIMATGMPYFGRG